MLKSFGNMSSTGQQSLRITHTWWIFKCFLEDFFWTLLCKVTLRFLSNKGFKANGINLLELWAVTCYLLVVPQHYRIAGLCSTSRTPVASRVVSAWAKYKTYYVYSEFLGYMSGIRLAEICVLSTEAKPCKNWQVLYRNVCRFWGQTLSPATGIYYTYMITWVRMLLKSLSITRVSFREDKVAQWLCCCNTRAEVTSLVG